MELCLNVKDVTKTYGAVCALEHANFELRTGEVMGLLGENGAGKSTLVKVLAGLVMPDSGSVLVAGKETNLFPTARSQEAGIAVVHQEYCSVPTMTVAENLVLGLKTAPLLWRPRALRAHARTLLDSVGLDDIDPRVTVESLSVAEVQLLEVARVISVDARILIFDEPTAALSDNEISRVMSAIRRLRDSGHSIVYITHRLAEVKEICDRVTVFRNGVSLPPVEVASLDLSDIVTMMLGREMESMFPDHTFEADAEPLFSVQNLLARGVSEPVSFEVPRGQIVGLTGQLGSGAGSVMETLGGLQRPLAGRVLLKGAELRPGSIRRMRQRGIAYCSPDRKRNGIFAVRSMRENLSSPWLGRFARGGWLSGGRERAETERIAQAFAADLLRLSTPVGALSGGNQQKVAVGRWLGIEPEIMLLEEPTRGVDIGARAEIYESLRRICDQGVGVVVASSDSSEILGLCDWIGTFYRGRMTDFRPRRQWTAEEMALQVMHGVREVA